MGVIYVILSKLGAAGKMIAMKKCGRTASGPINSLKINLVRSLGCFVISLVIALIGGIGDMSREGFIIAAISGIANAALLFSWMLGATLAPMSTVEIFCMIGGIVLPMIFSPIMIESEAVSAIEWVGALLLFPAAVCFRSQKSEAGGAKISALPYLILAGLSNAGCVFSQKLYAAKSGGGTAEFNLVTFGICSLTLAVCFLVWWLVKGRGATEEGGKPLLRGKTVIYLTIAVIMLYLANYFSLLASYNLPSSLLFPLSYAIGMPMTVACDAIFFKEKIRVTTVIGAVLVILSVILVSL